MRRRRLIWLKLLARVPQLKKSRTGTIRALIRHVFGSRAGQWPPSLWAALLLPAILRHVWVRGPAHDGHGCQKASPRRIQGGWRKWQRHRNRVLGLGFCFTSLQCVSLSFSPSAVPASVPFSLPPPSSKPPAPLAETVTRASKPPSPHAHFLLGSQHSSQSELLKIAITS